ncbi:MAG: YcgN family cysteine cluster protein [gamma proteobacterium symbiont of Bathyaustriella thionipta]|nr:YcgN family cysteine cluster protein [gamma proteobacterium symbiont of Bathyaustriella thionipta]
MSPDEWESLCDGCGKCCLHKLEDAESGKTWYTNVACKLLDTDTGRCRHYEDRQQIVPDCINLSLDGLQEYDWLPSSCAYRRLAEHKSLPDWHPLISKEAVSVQRAGQSVCQRVIPESQADDLEQHIITWIR